MTFIHNLDGTPIIIHTISREGKIYLSKSSYLLLFCLGWKQENLEADNINTERTCETPHSQRDLIIFKKKIIIISMRYLSSEYLVTLINILFGSLAFSSTALIAHRP